MKKVSYFFWVINTLFCAACHKQNEPVYPPYNNPHTPAPCHPTVRHITNPMLLTFQYNQGSYWVFKDSLSDAVDTLFVKSLSRLGYLPEGLGCDTLETFMMTLMFKEETISAFKLMVYQLFPDHVTLRDNFIWPDGGNTMLFFVDSMDADGCKVHDSLLINSTYYKSVGESGATQFVSDDPNRMESQSMKTFLSPEWGPLQFDFRDRLSGQLTGRRKVIARNIVR